MRISRSHLNLSLRVTWTWERADNSFRQPEHISSWKTECTTIRSTRYEVANKFHQDMHSIYTRPILTSPDQLTWPMGWMDFRSWMNLELELECVALTVHRSEKIPQTGGRRSSALYGAWARTPLSEGWEDQCSWMDRFTTDLISLRFHSVWFFHWGYFTGSKRFSKIVRIGENWPTGPLVWIPYKVWDSCCLVGWLEVNI